MRLRSYTLPDNSELEIPATICQAALATSAATTFFDPAACGALMFVDGGLGANNPVDEVEGEASNIWCPNTGDLKPLVKCFISIGTGKSEIQAIKDNITELLTETLKNIATSTEATARKFIARWAGHFDVKRYFRFNVDVGLADIGLAEHEKRGEIEAATITYLSEQSEKFQVRDCVGNLEQKESVYIESFA